MTLTASTTLETDLVDCPGDGLVVGADDITIDLNGHIIDGPGTADFRWDGVDNGAGYDSVKVKNGTIQDFGGDGVYIDNQATTNRLSNLVLTDNGIGVEVFNSDRNAIRKSSILTNHHEGVVIVSSTKTRVQGSVIAGSDAENSVLLRSSSDSFIGRNVIGGGVSSGIQSLLGEGPEIVRNRIWSDGSSAVGVFFDSGGGLISRNDIFDFDQAAVVVGGDETVVEKNLLHDSGLGVIMLGNPFFCCPTGVVATRNEVFNNDVGIAIRNMAETLALRNFAHDNTIGITVRDSTATVLKRNRANHNADDGILVSDPDTTITRDTANFNGDLGIDAVLGVTDGGGNRAHGNGNPAQCIGVVCSTGGMS